MPETEQLRAFAAAVQNGSFSAAGRDLGKAQSAISAAIANLEIDLNLTLFDRQGYRPELTDQGESIRGYVATILESIDALESLKEQVANLKNQKVRPAPKPATPPASNPGASVPPSTSSAGAGN